MVSTKKSVIAAVSAVVLLVGFSMAVFGLSWITWAESAVRVFSPFFLIILVCAVVGWFIGGDRRRPHPARRRDRRRREFVEALTFAGIGAFVGILLSAGYGFLYHNYAVYKAYSADTVKVDTITDFQERAPWVVANNYATKYQGDDIGEGKNVKHIPVSGVDDSSRYSRLIVGRSAFGNTGYTSVREFDVPKTGPIPKSATESCEFSENMGKRWEITYPWRSLGNQLSWMNPFLHYNYDDGYGYCNDGKPVVVMPLWKYEGFWFVKIVPAGAAVYDSDGFRLMDAKQLVKENIEGPTYPQSITNRYRYSLNAANGYGGWFNSTSGYDLTTKDLEDSNAGNASNFSLVDDDGGIHYITPMTPRGDSESITAVFVAPAQQGVGDGKFRVETGHDLPATSSIETSIRSSNVKGDPSWGSRWADGTRMRVYEIIPFKDGFWVASIGLGQEVSYRAMISPDGEVSVQMLSNEAVGDNENNDSSKVPTVVVDGGKQMSEMTDEELYQLIKSAVDELENR